MYNYIVNPETGRKVNINGRLGRKILKRYLMVSELVRNSNRLFNRYQRGGNLRKKCDNNCLNRIFGNFRAVAKTEVDLNDIGKNNNVNATYGTITPKGIATLLSHLEINSNDTFLDLGSGIGNVVVQFALNSNVHKARGIEYVKSRYNRNGNCCGSYQSRKRIQSNATTWSY